MRRLATGLAAVVLLAACTPGSLEAAPFEGVWRSEGWGTFLVVGGDVEYFEHTSVHCLSLGTTGARGIADSLSFEGDRLVLQDSDREIRFDRIDVLPPICADAGLSTDPASAVSVLAATVEEQFVGDLDPGWDERREEALVRAHDGEDLLGLLVDLVEPLGGRVRIAADTGRWPEPPVIDRPAGSDLGEADAYALGEVDGIGLLALGRTGPFDADPEASQRITGRIVDRLVAASDSVILDLRASSGGTLTDGLLIATRFAQREGAVASLRARAGDAFVPAGDLSLTPVPTGTFDGQVFVLVGPETRGVGELLAHVLGDLDRVTILGHPTAGDPGPALVRNLPNGWSISVPNLTVLDVDGTVLGPVEPDVVTDDPVGEALRVAGR